MHIVEYFRATSLINDHHLANESILCHPDSSVYQLKCSYCAYFTFSIHNEFSHTYIMTRKLALIMLIAEKKVVFSQSLMEGSSSKIIGTFSNPTIFMDGERIYVLFW